jgi:ArsR family transcriptional regulator, arsenate/arsenite/antimonite-responsive transcriptional repressor
MEKRSAAAALAALAQENRLDVFRLLAEAGPDGMPAGAVAEALGLAPNTLTFHFDRLRQASLVTVRRNGRSMIYSAHFVTINALLGFEVRAGAYLQSCARQARQNAHLIKCTPNKEPHDEANARPCRR